MKRMRFILIIHLTVLALFIGRCTKDGSDLLPKGNVVGYVFTFNEFRELLNDHSGVKVFTRGEHKSYQTTTDKQGRFELKDLPAGTYELVFSKPGFGTLKQFGIRHLGGEPTVLGMPFYYSGNAFFLMEIPVTLIDEIWINDGYLYCRFSFKKPAPAMVPVRVSFSLTDNFDLLSAMMVKNPYLSRNEDIYSSELSFINPPFAKGDKVFFRGQVSPYSVAAIKIFNNMIVSGIQYYYDYQENRIIYPSLGTPSAQSWFIF